MKAINFIDWGVTLNDLGRGNNQNNSENSVLTKETFGMTLILFGALIMLILITRQIIFGNIGVAITSFLFGVFGYFSFIVASLIIYAGVNLVFGSKIKLPKSIIIFACLAVLFLGCLIHTLTTSAFELTSYGEYLSKSYSVADGGLTKTTCGGVILSIIVFPIIKLTTNIGGYIIFSMLFVASCYFIFAFVKKEGMLSAIPKRSNGFAKEASISSANMSGTKSYPVDINFSDDVDPVDKSRHLLCRNDDFGIKTKKELAKESKINSTSVLNGENLDGFKQGKNVLYGNDSNESYKNNLIFDQSSYFNNPNRTQNSVKSYSKNFSEKSLNEGSYTQNYVDDFENNISYSNIPKKIIPQENVTEAKDYYKNDQPTYKPTENNGKNDYNTNGIPDYKSNNYTNFNNTEILSQKNSDEFKQNNNGENYSFNKNENKIDDNTYKNSFDEKDFDENLQSEQQESSVFSDETNNASKQNQPVKDYFSTHSYENKPTNANLFDEDKNPFIEDTQETEPIKHEEKRSSLRNLFSNFGSSEEGKKTVENSQLTPKILKDDTAVNKAEKPKHVYKYYNCPPISLLKDYQETLAIDYNEVENNKNIIVETLRGFKIPAEIVKVTQGPAVTRYDINIPGNIPFNRVVARDVELATRLQAIGGVNIQAHYGSGTIAIEVPNKTRATVGLKNLLLSEKFTKSKPGSLMFGLGKDIEGNAILGDIVKMKHLLVAGSTGSGKSVCLTSLIISLLYKYSPEELRLILVDPKQIEFTIYDKLPHLMINEIISDANKVIVMLNWAINEMERRYSLFKERALQGFLVRDIDEYNKSIENLDEEKIPRIVIIVDELADLMSMNKNELQDRVQRLAQKSRAAGIHLVLATQRPSVDVITGTIKNNMPTRIGFKVVQEVDSRTMIDCSGAEKLLGNGDMLYKTDTMSMPERVQGAFLSSAEVQQIVEYIKANNEAYYDETVNDYINNTSKSGGGADNDPTSVTTVEDVYIEALKHVVTVGQASISMIQRRCSVGYAKAGKIVEWMEQNGYISAFDGMKSRKVLITMEDFVNKYGDIDF